MRSWVILALAVAACDKPGSSAVRDGTDTTSAAAASVAVTDAERQRMEQAVNDWIKLTMSQWEQGDSAALMGTYPSSGPLVSAGNGELTTSRDSVAGMLAGLSQTSDRKTSYQNPKIDVLAPGVAAVTLAFRFEGKQPDKKPFNNAGVYSAVLAERDGKLQIVQEHQSMLPAPKKK
jgi:hypothetical protein